MLYYHVKYILKEARRRGSIYLLASTFFIYIYIYIRVLSLGKRNNGNVRLESF